MAGMFAALLTARAYEVEFPMAGTTSTVKATRVVSWAVLIAGSAWIAAEPRMATVVAVLLYGALTLLGLALNRVIVFPRARAASKSRVVVCGMNGDAVSVADRLSADEEFGPPAIVGLLTPETTPYLSRRPRIGAWEDIPRLYTIGMFDEIVFSVPQSAAASLPLTATAAQHRIPFRFEPYERGMHFSPSGSDTDISIHPPITAVGRGVKRLTDLAGSLTGSLIFAPVFLAIALLIRLDSHGPILFRQRRVGLNGKLFTMFKFRSMTRQSPEYAFSPTETGDSRVTRVGRFLRRTSLDEIPQLINVVRGDMSLVGPRPEMPFIVEQYGLLENLRHLVKPGMTGLWQTSRHRNRPIHENIHYDLYYVQNQSLILDFVILVRTVFLAFRGI
jgi:exopolysaccharide biosynthesis polyprenyl glycosylphosphotransferase